MFTRERTDAGHIRRVTITPTEQGWNVCEERDTDVVRIVTYTDWHRVERAIDRFKRPADPSHEPGRA